MKQTAVEWLVEQICGHHTEQWQKEIQQAKEMEKEQIIEAHRMSSIESGFEHSAEDWANTYYNETFKNK